MEIEFIYLDHAAATPIDKKVLKAMEPYFTQQFYNPSSMYAPAVEVKRAYRDAKSGLAQLLGAQASEIVITAGATESINLAFNIKNLKHVVTTRIEHQAVIEAARQKDHTLIDVSSKGVVNVEDVKKAIMDDTMLVSVALANNELGTVQPVKKIAEMIHGVRKKRLEEGIDTPIYLHTDASQGAGQLDLSVSRLGVDMMTLNAGKMYGPKQVGALWVRSGIELSPLVYGGGQERDLRSGTENVAGVIGFYEAFKLVAAKRKSEVKRLSILRDYMQNSLKNNFPDAIFTGDQKRRLSNFLHVSFPGLDGERLVFRLESRGILVATGSACAANYGSRSHVLTAVEVTPEVADGSLRITLGALSNSDNIKKATEIIVEEVNAEMERVQNG